MIRNATMPSQLDYVYGVGLHLALLHLWTIRKNQTMWPLLMDGVQLSQDYRTTIRRQFTFGTQDFRVLT